MRHFVKLVKWKGMGIDNHSTIQYKIHPSQVIPIKTATKEYYGWIFQCSKSKFKKKKLKRKNKNENCLTLHGLEILMVAWVLKKSLIFHLCTFEGIMYLWFSFCLDQWVPKKKKQAANSTHLAYTALTQNQHTFKHLLQLHHRD